MEGMSSKSKHVLVEQIQATFPITRRHFGRSGGTGGSAHCSPNRRFQVNARFALRRLWNRHAGHVGRSAFIAGSVERLDDVVVGQRGLGSGIHIRGFALAGGTQEGIRIGALRGAIDVIPGDWIGACGRGCPTEVDLVRCAGTAEADHRRTVG